MCIKAEFGVRVFLEMVFPWFGGHLALFYMKQGIFIAKRHKIHRVVMKWISNRIYNNRLGL